MSKRTAKKARARAKAQRLASEQATPCALISRTQASMLAELMDEDNASSYDTRMIDQPRRHFLGQTLTLGAGITITTLLGAVTGFR